MKSACSTPDQPEFIRLQYAFAASIRDPDNAIRPGDVDERRMAVYRKLFYNNIESLLANAFPVMHKLTPRPRWHQLVREFFSRHRARTPFFPQLPGEFTQALPAYINAGDPPWLVELARYEWVEMELVLAEGNPVPLYPGQALASARLTLSPLARRLEFRYPVHRIGPAFRPTGPAPCHLLVYRDREESVRFLELNPLTARLLGQIEAEPKRPAAQLLRELAGELAHLEPATVITGGLKTLGDLAERGVIEARI